jgi:hypothetical protein
VPGYTYNLPDPCETVPVLVSGSDHILLVLLRLPLALEGLVVLPVAHTYATVELAVVKWETIAGLVTLIGSK